MQAGYFRCYLRSGRVCLKKTAIIAGCTGPIGTAIATELTSRGWGVAGWSRKTGVDITDSDRMPAIDPNFPIHLVVHVAEAGLTGLLNVAIRCGPGLELTKGCYILLSSVHMLNHHDEYARSKQMQEREISSWMKSGRFRVNCLRLGHIAGTGAWPVEDSLRLPEIPLGRFGTPDDIAKAVVFIEEMEWMHGATIALDGGMAALL